MSNEIKTRPLTPTEQKYTYAQSMQLEGQTGTIGHLRGDFATTGYGFYTTWFDTRPQWKSDEFKADLDTVINALREDKGLLHNRYDMSAFARHFPESAIKGNRRYGALHRFGNTEICCDCKGESKGGNEEVSPTVTDTARKRNLFFICVGLAALHTLTFSSWE